MYVYYYKCSHSPHSFSGQGYRAVSPKVVPSFDLDHQDHLDHQALVDHLDHQVTQSGISLATGL